MNQFDERYEIRLADCSDIEMIMNFIDKYWKKGHIMSLDRDLFLYEYQDGDHINFILAIDKRTGLLEGIFGFIKCSDTKDLKKKDIWGSMWKVRENADNMPLLGIELAKRVFEITGCRTQIGNGANPATTIPLRRYYFHDKTIRMKQYYKLNPETEEFNIAAVKKRPKYLPGNQGETKITLFRTMKEVKEYFNIESIESIPYKDSWYVNKRFFCHPYYHYYVYGLTNKEGRTGALMMTRVIECSGAKVLRIVDYIGDQALFSGLGVPLERIMEEMNLEYVDFYTYGFKDQYLYDAGFDYRSEDDPNIIPNFFEPFLRENVDIWAHYNLEGTLFFKADGDQDRPNQLMEKPGRRPKGYEMGT